MKEMIRLIFVAILFTAVWGQTAMSEFNMTDEEFEDTFTETFEEYLERTACPVRSDFGVRTTDPRELIRDACYDATTQQFDCNACASIMVYGTDDGTPTGNVVTDLSYLFCCGTFEQNTTIRRNFNCDISGWDVSQVTTMRLMFNDNQKFNQNLSSWDTSSVTNMASMFRNNYEFNGNIDLGYE